MCAICRVFSINAAGSTVPVAIMPRITPPERSFLVSARVSISPIATMLWRVR
jgi:hypothetical protein